MTTPQLCMLSFTLDVRFVRQADAAFPHHGDEIPKAQLVAEIPTNAQNHDLLVEVTTFEQFLDGHKRRHHLIIAEGNLSFAPAPNKGWRIELVLSLASFPDKQRLNKQHGRQGKPNVVNIQVGQIRQSKWATPDDRTQS